MKTKIVYEDKDVLVVHKPAGLATQTAKVGQPDVVSELKCYLAGQERKSAQIYLGIVHRLDQPVEGLLIFAKNRTAAGALTKQLEKGILNKRYYAVICGKPLSKEGELVDYLVKEENQARVVTGNPGKQGESKTPEARKAIMQNISAPEARKAIQQKMYAPEARKAIQQNISAPEAKKAILQYRILQEISTPEKLALADIHIDTGRFHQIRAQMSHAGMPLLGDSKYGDDRTRELGRSLGVRNVALCAYFLTFEHPVSGKKYGIKINPAGREFSYFSYFDENE